MHTLVEKEWASKNYIIAKLKSGGYSLMAKMEDEPGAVERWKGVEHSLEDLFELSDLLDDVGVFESLEREQQNEEI